MSENGKEALDRTLRETAAMTVLTVLSGLIFIGSVRIWVENPIVNSPGIFPTAVSGVMLGCSVYILAAAASRYRQLKKDAQAPAASRVKQLLAQEMPFRTFFTMCMTVLYVIGFDIFGFYLPTAVFLMTEMLVFYRGKQVKRSVLVTAGVLVVVYVVIDRIFGIHF